MKFNKILLAIAAIIFTSQIFAQTVEHGRESDRGTVNFTTLANYLLAHPEPVVIHEQDDDDDGIIVPHVRPVSDSTLIRRRISSSPVHTSYLPVTSLPVSPGPTDTFEAFLDNISSIPPDTHGGVDSNYCVTAVNPQVTIQSRTGGAVSSVSLNAFFSSVNSVGGTFDPRVHYDPYSHRWILVCVSGANNPGTDTTSILIGVTQTSNPTGSWYLYRVRAYTAHTYWLDYPDVGFNGKWITVTGNLFQNSPGGGYAGAKVFAFNKASLLAGTGASYTAFIPSTSDFTICPSINYDANNPNMWGVESWNGTVGGGGVMNLWKLTGAVGSESFTHIAYPASPNNWDWECNLYSGTSGGDFAPQAGTSNKIQTNDDRVTQMIFMNGKLWFAHNVFLPYTGTTNPTRCSVQWWQIDTAGTPSQVGLIDDNTGANFYFFPSVAVNTNNDALIGFSTSSSSRYPSAAYALRVHSDATDSIRPYDVFRHGLAKYYKTYSGSKNRWGDYSSTCLDPINMVDFWTIQEASSTPGSGYDRWDTWWAHVLKPCSTPAGITGTLTVCVSATTTLADATSSGIWTSTSTSVATIGSSSGVVTGVSGGTSVITYSTGSGCNATATVTVNPLASPGTISGSPTVCVGATTTLSASGTGGGTWSSTNTTVGTVSTSGVVAGISGGTTTISYTVTNGCGAVAATQIVTVNPLATPGTISGTPVVCVGATTSLSASGTGGGTWSSTNPANGTVTTSGVVAGIAAGTTTISYTVTNSCGPVAATQVVTINPLATPGTISGTLSVCTGATTALAASGTGGGTWSSTNTGVGTVSSGGVVAGLTNGTTTISYTVTNSCGSVAATAVVTVNTTPTALTGTFSVCVGFTTTLNSTPSGGSWSSSNAGLAAVGSGTGAVTGIAAGTPTITYTMPGGCFAVHQVTVSTAPTTITGTLSVCTGSTTTLSSTPSGGTWTSSSSGVASVGTGSGIVAGNTVGTANITYTVTGGCYNTAQVTVNLTPNAITGVFAICTGATTTLNCTPSGGTWSCSNPAIGSIGSSSGVVSGLTTGTENITYTLPGGCFSIQNVTINTSPTAITGTATVCTGATTTLNCTPTSGVWITGGAGNATVGSGSGIVTGVTAGTEFVTYTLTTGCYTVRQVTVNTTPGATTGTFSICNGTATTLSSSPSGGTWTSSNSGIAPIGSSSGIATGVASGTNVMTYTLTGGCFTTHTFTVTANPSAITGTLTVCTGSATTLSSTPTGGTWTTGGFGNATVGSGSGIVSGVTAGTENITYTISGGCFSTTIVTVNNSPSAITGTFTVCVGLNTTLNSTPSGGSWSSGDVTKATVGSGTGGVTGVSAGVVNISYTLSSGCFAMQPVTVTTTPGAISGVSALCAGTSTTLTDPASGGTWSSSSPAVGTVGSSSGVVTGIAVGTTTITYALGSGCFATHPVTVTTSPGAISGSATVCTGANTTLTCSPTGGLWSSSASGIGSVGSLSGVVTGVSSGTAIITYSLGTGCESYQTEAVNASPAAITGTFSVCVGGTTTLSSATSGGSWTSSNTAIGSVTPSGGVVGGISVGTATITYTQGGCFVTQDATVNTTPTSITGTPNVCVGFTTTLNSTPSGGTWSSTVTTAGTVGSATGAVFGVGAGGTVISYTLAGGCGAGASVTVYSNPTAITGTASVCTGLTTTLNSTPSGGTWTSGSPAVASVGSATGVVSGATAGVAVISYTQGAGSCFATKPVSVVATPGAITGTLSVCSGATTTLSSSPSGGVWTSSSTAIANIGSSTGIVTGGSAGTATITYTIGGACYSTITVTTTLTPSVSLGADPTAAFGATTANLTYSSTFGSPSTYSIVYSAQAHTAGFTDVTAASLTGSPIALTIPGGAPSSVYFGTVTVANASCTSAQYSFNLIIRSPTGGAWAPITNTAPHGNDGVMLLLTDGRVMCKAGGPIWDVLTPDIHGSYVNGTWSTTSSMANDRLYFSSQVLRDGRVYVAGGEYGSGGSLGEVYNPLTNTWSAAPSLGIFISDANSEILPDGRVLQAFVGGGTRHTRLWDPVTNTYSLGPDCLRTDNEAPWLKLPDNSIIFIDNYSTSSERYEFATNTWINDGTVPVNVYDPFGFEAGAAFLLPDGRGFFLGSSSHNAFYTPTGTTSAGSFAAAADIPGPSGTPDAAAAMMTTGNILVAASHVPTSGNHFPSPTSFFEYNYLTNSFGAVTAPDGSGSIAIPSYYTNMLDLPDGSVLFTNLTSNRYYEYVPSGSPLVAGKPTVNNVIRLDCDTFMATGTLFNGISEGAAYGDDWQMASNYPIIRLTSGTNVYYARTKNWNSTGVMRGAALDTTTFVLPAGMPAGAYTLEVVANGNPSAPLTVNTSLAITPTSLALCVGASSTLSDVWPGGTWSSANPAIGFVGSSSGIVSGVATGITTITYTLGHCFSTIPATINASPAAISPIGGASTCVGSSTTYTDATSGGTWTSNNTGIASVGSSSGVVTGVSNGVTTITYTLAGGCFAVSPVTVNTSPMAIVGPASVCVGATPTYTDATSGGTWSSSSPPVMTIGAGTGIALATSAGTTDIIYSTGGGCNAALTVTVVASPTPITGTTLICIGSTSTLSSTPSGGTWSSSTSGVAAVGSLTGSVLGVTSGTASISYTLGTGCFVFAPVTVNAIPTITLGANPIVPSGTTSANLPYSATSGSPSTYSVVYSGPAHTAGFIDVTGAVLTSTPIVLTVPGAAPSAVYSGTLTVAAGSCNSTGYLMSVTITSGGNTPPVFTGGSPQSMSLCGYPVANSIDTLLQINDPDVGNMETWTVMSPPSHGTITLGGSMLSTGGIITPTGYSYTVFPSYMGTDAFTMQVSDGAGGTASTTINVTSYTPPAIVIVTGGGGYCTGGVGVNVGLAGSAVGVNYQLYRGGVAVGAPVPGIGSALSFGLQTIAGNYTATATIAGTSCTQNMAGSVNVIIYPLPNIYTVTGGGSYCSGGTGVLVGLSSSDVGTDYQLYRGGFPVVGTITAGTGAPITFGLQTIAGTYTIAATMGGFTACINNMSGSVTVNINPLPAAYSVTGGGAYCIGGTGVAVGVSNSDVGINYQLFRGGAAIGGLVPGTGSAISFGLQTVAGIYTVVATDATTTCTNPMIGSVSAYINPLPIVFSVTGGGSYCTGGSGVVVGLSASSFGVNYQLYRGVTLVGSPVAGTGAAISFGLQTVVGTYTVVGTNTTTGCVNNMSGSAVVSTVTLPSVYTITGGGDYCTGGTGLHIGLSNSDIGASYQLYRGGSGVGGPIAGTGSSLDFGLQTLAGTYTIVASITGTSCTTNMSGSAVITIDPLPTVYTVTGGGAYCSGGSGVHVGLSGSATGVSYQLYLAGTPLGSAMSGTGAALDFGLQTTSGVYTVVATNTTSGCVNNMSGSVTVSISSLPTAYTVTGGGGYCAGGSGLSIGLSGSQSGVNYQLFNGGTPAGTAATGTGLAITFGLFTTAGTYTVVATGSTTSCTSNMTGSVTITINPLPTTYTVTGGGSYCAGGTGVAIGLSNSQSGVNYQLYHGATTSGTPVAGTGGAISFGLQTIASSYAVVAIDAATGCTNSMSGSITVSINPLPAVVTVTGGGGYCAGGTGVNVGLAGSSAGISYQLFLGGSSVGSPVTGTGSALSFGSQTTAGTYTVVATDPSTGCISNMSGSVTVSVYSLPAVYTVTGGGSYCAGGTGVTVGLSGSNAGTNYQLYLGGSPLAGTVTAGTGGAISFGLRTSAGTYTVVATMGGFTACTNNMIGSVTVVINPLPTAYSVTGGGAYCAGGTGVVVGLSGSNSGINYQLYMGSTAVGSPVAGTGAAISFGLQTAAGTYTVVATNTTTGCVGSMIGSVTVSINPLPTVFTVTGGGSYCAGGTGASIGLSVSTYGVNYQLYRGVTAVGSPVAGTGAAISFGLQTVAGTYTVVAANATTGCINNMSGSAVVSTVALPTVYTVTGGGHYCAGGTGLHVGLGNSAIGASYQLYLGPAMLGSPVAGTGLPLDFGLHTSAGTYTVVAAITGTACTTNMAGSVSVTVDTLPAVYTVTGGGAYCPGGTGVHIGLSSSATGFSYQLFLGGSSVGSAISGTGASLDFGLQTTAGIYTVVATNTSTGCVNNMSGSVTVSISPLPTAYTVTGGGSYCTGGAGILIGLSSSQAGVNYQLYNGGSPSGTPVAGTGVTITFGLHTAAGAYTVVATNSSTACTNNMTGSVTITINPLPAVYTITGGGTYCAGGSGITVGLSNSQPGVNYQLYHGSTTSGGLMPGTGAVISFGLQTVAGTYTVVAINAATGCTNNMTGTVTLSINPLPAVVSVTGGGGYCAGAIGIHVGLSASASGITYQLLLGGSSVGSPVAGTGSALDFGLVTTAGIYTATATNPATGCTNTMSGSATVSISPAPAIFTVTGGGSFCAGGTGVLVGLGGSSVGVSYQLYRGGVILLGSSMAGTGAAISFGLQTVAGAYTVVATNTGTACSVYMSGSATVVINPAPTAYTVTGGGAYCMGGTGVLIGISVSDIGITYQLFRGGTAVGSPVAGTGAAISFGLQTTAGTYTAVATNATTGCSGNMTGSVTVSVNPLPAVFAVAGGGSYCSGSGLHIYLSGSTGLTSYQLFRGGSPVGSPLAGTGAGLDFGLFTTLGTYTIAATNTTTGCTSNMSGSAVISSLSSPTAYTVTGGGAYCAGVTGLHVGLSGSNTGISYQLYNSGTPVGGPVAGTGALLDFGLQTTAGSYTVVATVSGTTCTATMSGSVAITVNPLPTAFTITGGGGYCSGGTGVHINLSGSSVGINYQLYRGSTSVSSPISGTGISLDFGLQTTAGTYTVVATNPITGCVNTMTGSVTVAVNPLPAVYSVTGGGSYCSGGAGVTIGLSGSQAGVSYQLYVGGVPSGSSMAGTGAILNFGLCTAAGTYTVVATNTITGCINNMSGSATISVNPNPVVYTVTGGGASCSGGAGFHIGLSGSAAGVTYQLYRSGTAVGSPVSGTGASIDFGIFTTAGTYTVNAVYSTTGCTNTMSGSATITINPSPAIVAVTGGGGYCSGGTGVHVGLAGSAVGINYQLYHSGTAVGGPVAGIGGALDFGLQTVAGLYTVVATYAGTSCSGNMSGSATVTIYTLPAVYSVTGGGSFCAGGSGVHIGVSGSAIGISYKMYLSGTPVGSPVSGTGAALDFGLYNTAGVYTVIATNAVTGCTTNMSGSATVTINPLPSISSSLFTVAPTATITLSGSPAGGFWASSATSVATIGSGTGIITGVSLGTTVITYTLPTGCLATHVVNVTSTGHRETPAVDPQGGNNTIGETNVYIVPNPNNGRFTLKGTWISNGVTIGEEELSLEITNLLGQVIYSDKIVAHNGEINEMIRINNSVANGMYLLNIHSSDQERLFHIVIKQ